MREDNLITFSNKHINKYLVMNKKVEGIIGGYANLITGRKAELKKKRLEICKDCPVSGGTDWCIKKNGGCGCFLPAKASHADERCPHRKW